MTTSNSMKYCTKVIRHELKLPFDYHTLRHTHATLMAQSGANPKALQKRLGHSKIETTLQIYVHATEQMENESVEIFEKAINKK